MSETDRCMLEVYTLARDRESQEVVREDVGVVPAETGDYITPEGRFVRLNLGQINARLKKERVVSVSVDGIGAKEISVGRKTGRGNNTLSTDSWLGVQFTNTSVLRPFRNPVS